MIQPAPDRSVRHFLAQFGNDLFRVDGRALRAARQIVFQPGRLEGDLIGAEAVGRSEEVKRRAVHPVRFYLLVNVLFFFAVPWLNSEYGTVWSMTADSFEVLHPSYHDVLLGQAESLGLQPEVHRLLFDQQVRSGQGAFVAVMIPIFAALLWLAFRRRRRWFVDHLLIATSAYSVFLLSLLVFGATAHLLVWLWSDRAFQPVMAAMALWALLLTAWHWSMLRRFYGVGKLAATLLAMPSWAALMLPSLPYMHLLFWATWLRLGG